MSYIKVILVIKFLGLVFANSNINNWNLETSTINLLLNKAYCEKLIFNETNFGKNIYIKKTIYKIGNQVKNDTTMIINNQQKVDSNEIGNIQTFYYLHDIYYICLKENNIYYSDGVSSAIHGVIGEYPNPNVEKNLKCNYINGDNRFSFVFLNSNKNNLIYLKYLDDDKYPYKSSPTIYDEFYDFFAYSINTTTFYMNMILFDKPHISLYNIKIDSISLFSNKTIDLIKNAIYYSHRYLYFYKETKFFYFMLYNTVYDFTSGYSLNEISEEISENKNIQIYTNSESPLKIFGEPKINYLKFIRNTKLAYYEIETENKIIYHGILDIKLNKIIFNTDDYIKEFMPLTNYSMLAITNDSAYEICPFIQDGKCIEDCEEGQELVINYEKGNYCAKPEPDNDNDNDNFNYILWIPIILGILALLLTLIITIFILTRMKKKEKIEICNEKQMDMLDNSYKGKD